MTQEPLSQEELADFRAFRPVLRAVAGAGTVLKWTAISLLSLLAGIVLLGESVMKIVGWFWPPPPLH